MHILSAIRQAIKRHLNSAKHRSIVFTKRNTEKMEIFFFTKNDTGDSSKVLLSSSSTSKVQSTCQKSSDMNSFVTKDNILASELLWAMKLVSSHISFNSFNDAALLFQRIFDDSEKAKSMSLERAKISYLVSFGLAPYFKKMLISDLKDTEYVICFDEAVNRIIQKGRIFLSDRTYSDGPFR